MKDIEKYRGCLVGGAVGDALGYPVEFLDAQSIYEKYGQRGITEYQLREGVAQISDDTQMTLFTANGLLLGNTRGKMRGIMGPYPSYIACCYGAWLKTQMHSYPLDEDYPYAWLVNVEELFSRRVPGSTCIEAIDHGANGTIENPINNSKGCGGVMRVAPIGLYFEEKPYSIDDIDMIAAQTAALTHGHELGYIPAAALAHIVHLVSHSRDISLLFAVEDAMGAMKRLFSDAGHLDEMLRLLQKAIDLSLTDALDVEAIDQLGQGWVGEETLAIAVYCSLKHPNDFEKSVIAAVNHSGDSDSTGSVTGNIMGAHLGLVGIPSKFTDQLELKDVIMEIADDLYNDCQISEFDPSSDGVWESKYISMEYGKDTCRSVYPFCG